MNNLLWPKVMVAFLHRRSKRHRMVLSHCSSHLPWDHSIQVGITTTTCAEETRQDRKQLGLTYNDRWVRYKPLLLEAQKCGGHLLLKQNLTEVDGCHIIAPLVFYIFLWVQIGIRPEKRYTSYKYLVFVLIARTISSVLIW